MTAPRYNLATQQWLPTLDLEGNERTLSLIELFEAADPASPRPDNDLATGFALTDHAVWRLLLAIVYSAQGSPSTAAEAPDFQAVAEWVRDNASEFDLYDTERPFYQSSDPELTSSSPLANIDLSVAVNRGQFNNHNYLGKTSWTDPELALALITTQAAARTGRFINVTGGTPSAGTLTASPVYRPDGPLGDSLSTAWIPVPNPGRAMLTWVGPEGHDRTNEAQMLTRHARRTRFELDDQGHVVGLLSDPTPKKITFEPKTAKAKTNIALGYPNLTSRYGLAGMRDVMFSNTAGTKNLPLSPEHVTDEMRAGIGTGAGTDVGGIIQALTQQPAGSIADAAGPGRYRTIHHGTRSGGGARAFLYERVVDTREAQRVQELRDARKAAVSAHRRMERDDRRTRHLRDGGRADDKVHYIDNPIDMGQALPLANRTASLPTIDEALAYGFTSEVYTAPVTTSIPHTQWPSRGEGLTLFRPLSDIHDPQHRTLARFARAFDTVMPLLPKRHASHLRAEKRVSQAQAMTARLAQIVRSRTPEFTDLPILDDTPVTPSSANDTTVLVIALMAVAAQSAYERTPSKMHHHQPGVLEHPTRTLAEVMADQLNPARASVSDLGVQEAMRIRAAGLRTASMRTALVNAVARASAEGVGFSWVGLAQDLQNGDDEGLREGWAQTISGATAYPREPIEFGEEKTSTDQ